MKRRTKIVCTLGPAVNSREKVHALICAGMNVARINCSHGDWETRARWIEWIRELSPEIGPVGIMADLQGPKFRIGEVAGGAIEVRAGQTITLSRGAAADLRVPNPVIASAMAPGDRLLLGDGEVLLRLGPEADGVFEAKVVTGGSVKSHQGVTLVGRSFDVPALADKDREDVERALQLGVDFIALSYVRRAEDMIGLRELVSKVDPEVRLCAKVETREALKNLDGVIAASDVVMVARGDLGLQMDLQDVPLAQKQVIRACNLEGVPVITATQMLESMLHAARPTRAEASDVANAILDGTDAVMLSGETAAGRYPIEAVRTMSQIAEKAERLLDRRDRLEAPGLDGHHEPTTECVAHAAAHLAQMLGAKAIVTTSATGTTPRMVSRYRPHGPILCSTWSARTQRFLSVVWGVETAQVDRLPNLADLIEVTTDRFVEAKLLKAGDKVVVTAGYPAGAPGKTNLVLVQDVG